MGNAILQVRSACTHAALKEIFIVDMLMSHSEKRLRESRFVPVGFCHLVSDFTLRHVPPCSPSQTRVTTHC